MFGTPFDNECAELCAYPSTTRASVILFLFDLCHLMPMENFLIAFYFIPRRYYLSGNEEDIKLVDINEPLLQGESSVSLFQQMDENLN